MRPLFRVALAVVLLLCGARAEAATINLTAGPTVAGIAGRQVSITWSTNLPGASEVACDGVTRTSFAGYVNQPASNGRASVSHSVTLRRLKPGTYYCRVRTADQVNIAAESGEFSFLVPGGENFPLGDYSFNGAVHAIGRLGNAWYVGGQFTAVGVTTGGGVTTTTGPVSPGALASQLFPEVAGVVHAAVPDGRGGLFLGGEFRAVGGLEVSNLAHLLPDLGVDPGWKPFVDGPVYALALSSSGTSVYVGGAFGKVMTTSRAFAAEVSVATPAVVSGWYPSPDNAVYALAVDGNAVYLGGAFTQAGGLARNHVAAVSSSSGAAVSGWDANVGGDVRAIAVGTSAIYLGGRFTNVGMALRPFAAAVTQSTGTLVTSWNPAPDGAVEALAVRAATGGVFLVGRFEHVTGSSGPALRTLAAEVDGVSGVATAWAPVLDGAVASALAVFDGTVYVGGSFAAAGGTLHNAVALDAAGAATGWAPQPAGPVNALAAFDGATFVGGAFSTCGARAVRRYAAALDGVTGAVLPWNPDLNAPVKALVVRDTAAYLGGLFTQANGTVIRNRAAAVDLDAGALGAWNPDLNDAVEAMEPGGADLLLLGGRFTAVNGGTPWNRAAVVDLGAGTLKDTWKPDPNGPVFAIKVSPSRGVLLGGAFTALGSSVRRRAGAVNSTGAALPWDPDLDGEVYALAEGQGRVYVGGAFGTAQGAPRQRVAAFDMADGGGLNPTWKPWVGPAVSSVNALAVGNDRVLVGGNFQQVNAVVRRNLAAVDLDNGQLVTWNPEVDRPVNALAADCAAGGLLAVGGDFFAAGAAPRGDFALLQRSGFSCVTAITPPIDGGQGDGGMPSDAGTTSDGGAGGAYSLRLQLPATAGAGDLLAGTLTIQAPVGTAADALALSFSGDLAATGASMQGVALAEAGGAWRLAGGANFSGTFTVEVQVRASGTGPRSFVAELAANGRPRVARDAQTVEVGTLQLSTGACGCGSAPGLLPLGLALVLAARARRRQRPEGRSSKW